MKARHPQDGETSRKVVHFAPAERQLALCKPAAECPGVSEGELIRQACEFFGWRRTGKDIRDCRAADIAELYRQRRLAGGPERSAWPAERRGTPGAVGAAEEGNLRRPHPPGHGDAGGYSDLGSCEAAAESSSHRVRCLP